MYEKRVVLTCRRKSSLLFKFCRASTSFPLSLKLFIIHHSTVTTLRILETTYFIALIKQTSNYSIRRWGLTCRASVAALDCFMLALTRSLIAFQSPYISKSLACIFFFRSSTSFFYPLVLRYLWLIWSSHSLVLGCPQNGQL
jgi:hypothetical protein